ncbi:Alpha/Beta hydrolase protein [Syncephalastrum racemosum]|uniref:Alpha/Beta hydrolase protein n=1 Tax=Syncephalastrum racemosum TaxID=13706 RepID=A0A1X2H761_SYNRA|nr:Alpha/Beta hydrolase protein [Syncephalastrum racemosum]
MMTELVFEQEWSGNDADRERTTPKLPWQHPYKQGYCQVGNGRTAQPIHLYYELHGQGPNKVALIQGLNSPCQAWDYQTTFFAALDYTVLVFDARGVGWTGGSWDWYNTEEWARDFLELLDYVGWTEDVHALGQSAGGQVMLKALLLDKDPTKRFRSASLLNTTAGGTRPLAGAWTLATNLFVTPDQQIARLIRTSYTKAWLDAPSENDSSKTNFDLVRDRIMTRNARSRPQTPGAMLSQAIASLRHWVTAADLEKIKATDIPTLVVTNAWDNFVHTSHSYYLKEKLEPRKFVIFEDAGHIVPTEKYKELNNLLDIFWHEVYNESNPPNEQPASPL